MQRPLHLLAPLILALAGYGCSSTTWQRSGPVAGQGILVGGVTATRALAQVRLTGTDRLVKRDVPGVAGTVKFSLYRAGEDQPVNEQEVSAVVEHDFIARAVLADLKPGTSYRCVTRIGSAPGSLRPGPVATFRTLPGKDRDDPVSFVVVTGMNYAKFHGDDRIDRAQHLLENNTKLAAPYAGPDKHLGYPGLVGILQARPDFFVGTGDNVYYDTPDNPRAATVTELRQKWHEQFVQPRYRDLFARVPTYWMVDDHDYRIDDGDNSGDYDPTPEAARRMMLEQLPLGAMGDERIKTYRTHRINRDLQIWLPEGRVYRSDNATPDGPGKTIWGAAQKAWLKRTLAASDARFKLLISPTPMIGPDDVRKTDNHTNHGGFRHERDEFFAWLKTSGLDRRHFYIICGDRHWQYHSVHPTGIEEFSCGALIDENSRLGRKPGDPASTDPQGLIKQPYYQTTKSGGFLRVATTNGADGNPPKHNLTRHDEHGTEHHTTVKL